MPIGGRRGELDIIRDILVLGGGNVSHLRLIANLSQIQLDKYICVLEKANLITLHRDRSRGKSYEVTTKGEAVVRDMDALFRKLGIEAQSDY